MNDAMLIRRVMLLGSEGGRKERNEVRRRKRSRMARGTLEEGQGKQYRKREEIPDEVKDVN